MQWQLIQNFIELPGIIGFSLMSLTDRDTSSDSIDSVGFISGQRPEESPILVQGIQQIIQTTPASLENCAFQFGLCQVELHKVENGVILLIVSEGRLSHQHAKAVSELLHFIKADYAALIESIRAINANAHEYPEQRSKTMDQFPIMHVDDLLEAMNSVSHVASRYLGPRLVADHWRASRVKDLNWLKQFRIAADGTVSTAGNIPELTPEQLAELRFWIQRFHQRCTRFIRDYDTLVEESLPQHYWHLLFGK